MIYICCPKCNITISFEQQGYESTTFKIQEFIRHYYFKCPKCNCKLAVNLSVSINQTGI